MGFKEGNKGRPKGSGNKLTQDSRQLFKDTLEAQSEHLETAFNQVREESPKEFLKLFSIYAKFFMPVMTEATNKIELNNSKPFNIKDVFKFDTDD